MMWYIFSILKHFCSFCDALVLSSRIWPLNTTSGGILATVERVSVHSDQMDGSLFAKCFPNIRRLHLESVFVTHRFSPKPFINLEMLSIDDLNCNEFTTERVVSDILDGVQGLKWLKIYQEIYSYETDIPPPICLNWIMQNPGMIKIDVRDCQFSENEIFDLVHKKRMNCWKNSHSQCNASKLQIGLF